MRFGVVLVGLTSALACSGVATSAPPDPVPVAVVEDAPSPSPTRALRFNQHPASADQLATLAPYERAWGVTVPDGDYWYDARSGAAGLWGGPTRGFLAPGLPLGGGPVPANASGGGDGRVTGVFVNGRELHPLDVAGLTQWLGSPPWPGRWWVDGQGNFGVEGQPAAIGNLPSIASQRRGGGAPSYYSSDPSAGSSVFVGTGCASVSGRLSPSDSDSSYSYFVGCD